MTEIVEKVGGEKNITFIWFPEGCVMEHGATEDEDCEALFISDKTPGHITFV